MDVKPVYQLVGIDASLTPGEAEQLLAELDTTPPADASSALGQLHTALASAASSTQQR